jgi:hypothetical protein
MKFGLSDMIIRFSPNKRQEESFPKIPIPTSKCMFFCSVQLQPKPSSPNPDTVANQAQLKRIRRINGLLIGLVRGDSTQRAPHVRIKNLQAIHVASINPAEPANTKH